MSPSSSAALESDDERKPEKSSAGVRRWPLAGRVWLVGGAVLLALAPVIVTLCCELSIWSQRALFQGDLPLLEVHVMDFMRGKHLLGAYSRMGWHHPGPLYFAALVPLYVLSGHASGSLFLSAALLAVAAVVAMLAVFWRLEKGLPERLLFVALLCSFLAHFGSLKGLGFPWNPSVCVLPFGVYWLLLVALAAGRLRVLPTVALLHAFLVQTHISYVLVASVTPVLALVLRRLQLSWDGARRPHESLWRVWSWTAVVVGVAWAAPVWAELRSGTSNVATIIASYDAVSGHSSLRALELAACELFSPLLHATGVTVGSTVATTIAAVLLCTQAVALVWTARKAFARRERLLMAGSVLGLAGLLLVSWSARHVGRVPHAYLTYWFGLLGTLNWLPIVRSLLAPRIERSRVLLAVSTAAAVSLSALATGAATSAFRWSTGTDADRRDIAAAADVVGRLAVGTDMRPPAVLSRGLNRPNLTGVVAMLRKRGVVPLLDERLHKFGGGFEYRSSKDTEYPWLVFAGAPSHAHPILANFGELHLYWRTQDQTGVSPQPTTSASGVEGDPAVLLDDPKLKERLSSVPRVLTLKDESSEVILHLGGALVATLGLRAPTDAGYTLEASTNGRTYELLATLPAGTTSAMTTQHFAIARPGPWEALRVKAFGGRRKAYVIAKLSPKLLGWGVRVESSRGLEGDLSRISDGRSSAKQAEVVRFSGPDSELTVSLPSGSEGVHIVGLRLDAQVTDVYSIEGSYDGAHFEPIGVSSAVRGAGMRWRLFRFNDARAWRYVRLSPAAPLEPHALAELSAVMADGTIIDLEAPPKRAAPSNEPEASGQGQHDLAAAGRKGELSLSVELETSRAYELLVAAAPNGPALFDVATEGQSLGTLDMAPTRTMYHLDVPAGAPRRSKTTRVVLSPASNSPSADMRLRSLLFRAAR